MFCRIIFLYISESLPSSNADALLGQKLTAIVPANSNINAKNIFLNILNSIYHVINIPTAINYIFNIGNDYYSHFVFYFLHL